MINALSIDVEEYYHAEAFAGLTPSPRRDKPESRVESSTVSILDLLDRYGVRATFFVLGSLAERLPHLVVEIASRGHEVGSHGYDHSRITGRSPEEFRRGLRKSRQTLERILQEPITGYRAPTFSVTEETLWALDIMYEEGFGYDSSIFPIHHDRYGIPDAPRFPYRVWADRDFFEFPASTLRRGPFNFPLGGGGYLRLLPFRYTLYGIKALNKLYRPAMVYLHPWEIDALQPRLGLRGFSAFRHYHNLDKTLPRLRELLRSFSFAPLREVLQEYAPLRENKE